MKWFSKTGYQNTKALTGQVLTDLNEVLGIMKYYQQDECGRRMLSFNSSNMDGLKNGTVLYDYHISEYHIINLPQKPVNEIFSVKIRKFTF